MTEKEKFIEKLKLRTRKFTIDIIELCDTLKNCPAAKAVTYRLIKSSSSTGANYRAACRARSKAEFFSKLSIVVEEADESLYWLEVIRDAKLSDNKRKIDTLLQEAE